MSRTNEDQGGVTEQIKSTAQNVVGAAKEQYEHLRDTAGEYYDQGKEKAQEWQHGIEQYVQEKPMKALLIAAGIGVLLGVLWKKS